GGPGKQQPAGVGIGGAGARDEGRDWGRSHGAKGPDKSGRIVVPWPCCGPPRTRSSTSEWRDNARETLEPEITSLGAGVGGGPGCERVARPESAFGVAGRPRRTAARHLEARGHDPGSR